MRILPWGSATASPRIAASARRLFHPDVAWPRRIPLDLSAAMAILVLTSLLGGLYCLLWRNPTYYPGTFGPSVAWACGRGYVNPAPDASQALTDFTNYSAGSGVVAFSCADLPTDLRTIPLWIGHKYTPYMFLAVGTFWRVFGISWDNLWLLMGLFYGVSGALFYALLRFGMGRLLSALGALLLASSPMQLAVLPHLRDYTKAPFFLALLLILAYLVRQPRGRRAVIMLSALYGATLGLALGFRPDFMVMIPPLLITLFFFLPGPLLTRIKMKAMATVVAIAGFLVLGGPVVFSQTADGSQYLVVISGIAKPFNQSLAVNNPLYTWSYLYPSDLWLKTSVNSYSYRTTGSHELQIEGIGAPAPFRDYFLEIARNFPADMLTRTYAAVLRISDFAFDQPSNLYVDRADLSPVPKRESPPGVLGPISATWTGVRAAALQSLAGAGPWLIAAAILVVAAHSLRLGLFMGFFVAYFMGYTMLQFQARHAFHLEFVGLWALGFLLTQAGWFIRQVWRRTPSPAGARLTQGGDRWPRQIRGRWAAILAGNRRPLARLLVLAACGAIVIGGPLLVLRWYQQQHLIALFSAYEQAETEPLQTTVEVGDGPGQTILLRPVDFPRPESAVHFATPPVDGGEIRTEYLVADIDVQQCPSPKVDLVFRYAGHNKGGDRQYDFTQEMGIPVEGRTRVLIPIYDMDFLGLSTRFEGVELAAQDQPCLTQLSRVKHTDQYPLLMSLVLNQHWRDGQLYQALLVNPVEKLLRSHLPQPAPTPPLLTIDGWELIGVDADEGQLAGGEPGEIRLHWRVPANMDPIASETFSRESGQQWVQVLPGVRNLVRNGNFEGDAPFSGFPSDIYGSDRSSRLMAYTERNGANRRTAVLNNNAERLRSSLVTDDLPVEPDAYYLQMAWVRAAGGIAFVGRQWLPSAAYEYAYGGSSAPEWTRVAQIVTPPSNQVDAMRVWLLNYESAGSAFFGDVVFARLGRRSTTACQPNPASGRLACQPPIVAEPTAP